MPELPTAILWVLVGLAAIWDVAQRRIPNRLVLVGLLAGTGLAAWSGGFAGLGRSLLGAATALAILLLPFALRRLGGGDVKLAMLIGAFVGWKGAVHVILVGTVLHGLLSLALLVLLRGMPGIEAVLARVRQVPHALGYAAATVLYTLGFLHFF